MLFREDSNVYLLEGDVDFVDILRQWLELAYEELIDLRVSKNFFDERVLKAWLGLLKMVLHVKIL